MSRSSRILLALVLGTGALISADSYGAEGRFIPSGEKGIAWLGEQLFFDARLSSSGTISCASCHDPALSFADGKAHSIGELGRPVGRNAPTLFEIGKHDLFVDPLDDPNLRIQQRLLGLQNDAGAQTGRVTVTSHGNIISAVSGTNVEEVAGESAPVQSVTVSQEQFLNVLSEFGEAEPRSAISLAERCLSPLGNELEMGTDIDATVANYRKVSESDALFDHVFASPGGVHRARIGEALAAYLRTLTKPAAAPYTQYLAGATDALNAQESRGLELFSGKGTCASCHAGESLRDGLVHITRSPNSIRLANPQRAPRQLEDVATHQVLINPAVNVQREVNFDNFNGFGGASGYGGLPVNIAATPTLWDVARTAPYFGDGTADTLERAIEIHVRELAHLRSELAEAKKEEGEREAEGLHLREDVQGSPNRPVQTFAFRSQNSVAKATIARAEKSIPETLRSSAGGVEFWKWPFPEELTEAELADLLAFLRTLSPRAM